MSRGKTMEIDFINELHELLHKYYPNGDPIFNSKWSKDYDNEVEIKILCYPKLNSYEVNNEH
tara:strand:- start:821 stop:1006 length:186 start_codon:yes stop_codon:yes gene_type:complete